ncbi:MAG: hypothetical protein GXX96_14230 [Planctomycetaceae bacterium]|mgnify:FL=1|nr:hypothetical protein [Planctomycetaceae bacterium]
MLDESAADRNSVGVGLGGKAQVLEGWLLFLVAGEVAVVAERAAEGRSLIDSDRLSGQPELMRRTSSVVVRVVKFIGHTSGGFGVVGGPTAGATGQGGLVMGSGLHRADACFACDVPIWPILIRCFGRSSAAAVAALQRPATMAAPAATAFVRR